MGFETNCLTVMSCLGVFRCCKPSSDDELVDQSKNLHKAIKRGNLERVQFLVKERYANVNGLTSKTSKSRIRRFFNSSSLLEKDFDMGGNSPLHCAVFYLKGSIRISMVRFFIEKGADMFIRNKSGKFAWQMTS